MKCKNYNYKVPKTLTHEQTKKKIVTPKNRQNLRDVKSDPSYF